MVTIIHGGHREGLCFSAASTLEQLLKEKNVKVKLFNLRNSSFGFCCGKQSCQNSGECIYSDVMTSEIIPSIANSDVVILFTPTYFNMPPAILKNFIDRCNLLLTIEDRKHPFFGAWVSGQTDQSSIEQCYQNLAIFSEICEFKNLDNGRNTRLEQNIQQTQITQDDIESLKKLISEIIALNKIGE
jgi:multimeric flavodoxin WrbA